MTLSCRQSRGQRAILSVRRRPERPFRYGTRDRRKRCPSGPDTPSKFTGAGKTPPHPRPVAGFSFERSSMARAVKEKGTGRRDRSADAGVGFRVELWVDLCVAGLAWRSPSTWQTYDGGRSHEDHRGGTAVAYLHRYMLEVEGIDHISDEMRAVVESEWPELAHKLPPKRQG